MTLRKVDDGGHMFNAASHILGVEVTPDRPMRVRRGRILAARGTLEYRHEQHDLDDTMRSRVDERGWSEALGDEQFRTAAGQRFEIEVGGHVALTGNLKMHRATGSGSVWLGNQGGDVSIFELVDDDLIVLGQGEVLAFDDTITATLEEVVPLAMAAVRDTTYAWVARGDGLIATATSGEVVMLDVSDDDQVLVEAEALLAYTAGVVLTAPPDFTKRAVKRGLRWLLKYIPNLNIDAGRERIWMVASGNGTIVIRSSD